MYDFINLRNEIANCQVQPIEETPDDFYAFFDTAMAIELETTAKLTNLAQTAMMEGDLQTFFWCKALIDDQNEDENLYRTILDRVTLCGRTPEMIHHYDQWIGTING